MGFDTSSLRRVTVGLLVLVVMGAVGYRLEVIPWLRGDAYVVDRLSTTVDRSQHQEIHFSFKNITSSPLMLRGAVSSCRCLDVPDLPQKVEPFASQTLTIKFRGSVIDSETDTLPVAFFVDGSSGFVHTLLFD